jgi:hypothetical protein
MMQELRSKLRILDKFAALENLDVNVDMSRA